jgi:hypothetical protein
MTRDDYKQLFDNALATEHGLHLSFGDWYTAERVRAQFYRVREHIRRNALRDLPRPVSPSGEALPLTRKALQAARRSPYDCLSFRLVDGNLYIIKRERLPAHDDALEAIESIPLTADGFASLPPWPPRMRCRH